MPFVLIDADGEILPLTTKNEADADQQQNGYRKVMLSDLDALLRRKGIETEFMQLSIKKDKISPQQIMLRLLSHDKVIEPTPNTTDHLFSYLFSNFCKQYPLWKSRDATTVCLFCQGLGYSSLHMDDFMVRSFQRQGTCFMQTAAVLQHYLVVKGSGRADHRKIDITEFCLDHLCGEDFEKYLNDRGGSCQHFFRLFTQMPLLLFYQLSFHPSDEDKNEKTLTEILSALVRYGPALIIGFTVDKAFMTSRASSFLEGLVDGTQLLGTHAMVLIGARADPTHRCVFLLQNWWKGRELLEVSYAYLRQSLATISFVTTELKGIPAQFAQIDAYVSESCADVGGDRACDDY